MKGPTQITVGVLALQGAFSEHVQLLRKAAAALAERGDAAEWTFSEIRTAAELTVCDALVIPGGESTTISLVAARSGLLDQLREFVKVKRKPTWGTCAGLILLAESANRTKKGGQELIGGLDIRVDRNHFGRQTESFAASVRLPFLDPATDRPSEPFHAIFIRAPVVEKILPSVQGVQVDEAKREDTVVAPSRKTEAGVPERFARAPVEILAALPISQTEQPAGGDIVAVRQGNCFGTSFHPELTSDARIHMWWLGEVLESCL